MINEKGTKSTSFYVAVFFIIKLLMVLDFKTEI